MRGKRGWKKRDEEKEKCPVVIHCLLRKRTIFVYRQRIKGGVLFLPQFLIMLIELLSGYWIEYFQGGIPEFSLRLHGGFLQKEYGA